MCPLGSAYPGYFGVRRLVVGVPILANITEFGHTHPFSTPELDELFADSGEA